MPPARRVPGPMLRQLGAYAALVTDPLPIVDAVHDSVVVTSEDYAKINVPVPPDSDLRSMVHPDDVTNVLTLVPPRRQPPGQTKRPRPSIPEDPLSNLAEGQLPRRGQHPRDTAPRWVSTNRTVGGMGGSAPQNNGGTQKGERSPRALATYAWTLRESTPT